MLDLDGHVTEGPGFNVFVVKGGTLFSPPEGILMGITRQTVFELAAEHQLPAREAQLTAYDPYAADEVFLTSTAGGIMPLGRDRRTSNRRREAGSHLPDDPRPVLGPSARAVATGPRFLLRVPEPHAPRRPLLMDARSRSLSGTFTSRPQPEPSRQSSARNEIAHLNSVSSLTSRWGHQLIFVEDFREGFPSCPGGSGNPYCVAPPFWSRFTTFCSYVLSTQHRSPRRFKFDGCPARKLSCRYRAVSSRDGAGTS